MDRGGMLKDTKYLIRKLVIVWLRYELGPTEAEAVSMEGRGILEVQVVGQVVGFGLKQV